MNPSPRKPPLSRALWQQLQRNKLAALGLLLLLMLVGAALFAPLLAWQDPYNLAELDILDARAAPGQLATDGIHRYWLGADGQGRDMLSAILYGLRISLLASVSATVLALTLGLTVGLIAGYRGGRWDTLLMRVADLQLSFPSILIALVLLVVLGQGVSKIILALVAVQWTYYARTARGVASVERHKDYVAAARLLGLSTPRILFKHLLPNCLSAVLVVAALQMAAAISLEATLSFLGLGLPVTEPSLGLLISNGFQYLMSGKYWISFFPGLALLLTIAAINLVADRLRDALNPRLQAYTAS